MSAHHRGRQIIEKKNVGEQYKKNLEIETEILRKVDHPSIIKLIEMFDTDEYLFLVMELVVGGELFDRIVEKGAYSEAEASTLVKHILEAISYLHQQNICHRDLKPENLLLATQESDTDIKISDFGLSKIISKKVTRVALAVARLETLTGPSVFFLLVVARS